MIHLKLPCVVRTAAATSSTADHSVLLLPKSTGRLHNLTASTQQQRQQQTRLFETTIQTYICILNLKLSHYTPPGRLEGEEVQILFILDLGTRRDEWSASRPGRALAMRNGPPVPIVQEAGWAPERIWTQRLEEKSFPLPEIEPRSPGRPARSQTLYLLSYTAHIFAY
jgi:hypothetical protein